MAFLPLAWPVPPAAWMATALAVDAAHTTRLKPFRDEPSRLVYKMRRT
jgi:hypothetical protein